MNDYTGAMSGDKPLRVYADYTQLIKLQPDNAQAYSWRANVDIAQGYFSRGVVHHKLRDYTSALSDYNQAVAKDEKFWAAIANIGHIKYENGITPFSETVGKFAK